MILSLWELIDIVIMTLAIGFIFMDLFPKPAASETLEYIPVKAFNWIAFKFSCWVTAPAIVLHEFSHKIAAIALGFSATLHASYFGLGLGILLKLAHSPILFFVPAYVSINCASAAPCTIPPLSSAITAFAGPGMNLLLFIISRQLLKTGKYKGKTATILYLTKQINIFLFIFNMLPLPMFDGYQVFNGLWHAFAA